MDSATEKILKDFINQRTEFVQAMRDTRREDDQADYFRWSGAAEARRQLAGKLGWTVPHEPGEQTEVKTEEEEEIV